MILSKVRKQIKLYEEIDALCEKLPTRHIVESQRVMKVSVHPNLVYLTSIKCWKIIIQK